MQTTTEQGTHRFYGYTKSKANIAWIDKGAKAHGSKAKFLDALITEARKAKIIVAAPTAKVAKKTTTKKISTKKLLN